jgi:hypothetical protein
MTNPSIGTLIQDAQSRFSKGELDIGKMLNASQKILQENGQDINLMEEIAKMAPMLGGAFPLPQ